MRSWMKSLGVVTVVVLASATSFSCAPAADPEAPTWDLSYRSVLLKNRVGPQDWLAQWLDSHESAPFERLLQIVKPARSAVLLEYPAFHVGERLTFLFTRTDSGALCWNYVDGQPNEFVAKPLDPNAFDLLIKQVLAWEQGPPSPEESMPGGSLSGYFAILSVRDQNVSKQLLLTLGDFKIPTDSQWTDTTPGKVYKTFEPVIRLYD